MTKQGGTDAPLDDPPRHIAIIMDGNGRWAERRKLPRFAGHRRGADTVEKVVEACIDLGVEVLTLFAFSSENWRRPDEEVGMLMGLFLATLEQKAKKLHRNGVRLSVIGDRTPFNDKLRERIDEAERLTAKNTVLNLVVAANYGGRWDISRAARRVVEEVLSGALAADAITPDVFGRRVCLADMPEPDLFIRTGGERRISNYLLWQLAYTELFFSEVLWPDFDRDALVAAVQDFSRRQRRFGRTGQQVVSGTKV